MEELLGAILAGMAEFLLEVFAELFLEALVAVIARAIRSFSSSVIAPSPVLASAFYLLLGSGFGAASLFLFPHPFFHSTRFHGISLLISPVATGLAMSQIGSLLRRSGREPVRIESFGYGFAFAFGMAAIRLIFTI